MHLAGHALSALKPSPIATTFQRLGFLFAGAGIVGSLALINVTSAWFAAFAFVCAATLVAPEGRVPMASRALFALAFALSAVGAYLGPWPMWLTTLVIIAALLALASLVSGWPRKAETEGLA